MPTIDERIQALKSTSPPELWEEILRREGRAPRLPTRPARWAVAAVALAVAAAGVAVVVQGFAGLPRRARPSRPPATVAPRVGATVPVADFVDAVAASEGSVWARAEDRAGGCRTEIVRIDQRTNDVIARIPIEGWAGDIAVGHGSVWVEGSTCGAGPGGALFRIDPDTNQVVDTIDVRGYPSDVAVSRSAVWVTATKELDEQFAGEVLRIDPVLNEVAGRIPIDGDPRDVVVGEEAVWVLSIDPPGTESQSGQAILKVDPATETVVGRIPDALGLGVGEGAVWVPRWANQDGTELARFHPRTLQLLGQPLPGEFLGFAGDHGTLGTIPVGEGGAWVRTSADPDERRSLARVNAVTLEVDASMEPPCEACVDAALDPSSHTLWLADLIGGSVIRVDLQ